MEVEYRSRRQIGKCKRLLILLDHFTSQIQNTESELVQMSSTHAHSYTANTTFREKNKWRRPISNLNLILKYKD